MALNKKYHLSFAVFIFCFAVSRCFTINGPRHRRMINGREVKNAKRWQTTVYVNFGNFEGSWGLCGGILVSNQWILTAAHPFVFLQNQTDYVTVGIGSNLRKEVPGPHNHTISRIVFHPDFLTPEKYKEEGGFSYNNDIALLKLSTPIADEFNYIDLAGKTEDISEDDHAHCYAAGWGRGLNKNTVEAEDTLTEIDIKLLTKQECIKRDKIAKLRSNFFGKKKDLALIICADMSGIIKQTGCYEDHGSPLLCEKEGKYKINGIMVGGHWSCKIGRTSMYFIEVSKYVTWIKNTIDAM